MKLSCISKFIERLVDIVKSGLDEEKQIRQIQRFKDHTHIPIFDEDHSKKLLQLMKLFINPDQIRRKKRHRHYMKHNPVYNRCMSKIMSKPIQESLDFEEKQEPHVSVENRDNLIQHLYDSLNKDELDLVKQTVVDLNNARSYVQKGGAKPTEMMSSSDASEINKRFLKNYFPEFQLKFKKIRFTEH